MNLRDIDFGSDGTSSFTVGPSNGTSGFANVLKHSNTGGGSANAYEWDVAGVGTVWRIGAQNISYVPLHSENSTSTTATPNLDLNDQQIVARSESFTDLGTTPQSLHGGVRLGVGFRMDCTLQTPAAHHATFTIYGGFQSGVAFLFSGVQGANCTLTETTDGNFEVTNVGDGRTYTLNVDTGSGTATLKADATVSGTTTLHYFLLAQRK